MPKISFSDGLAIVGIVLAIILVVLVETGKMRGQLALTFWLAVAAALMLPLALGNSWIYNTPSGPLKFAKEVLMVCLVGVFYALLVMYTFTPTKDASPPPTPASSSVTQSTPQPVTSSLLPSTTSSPTLSASADQSAKDRLIPQEIRFPLVDIELVRVKAEPPFEQFQVGFAYDISLHNKSNTVLSQIGIMRLINHEKNKQKMAVRAGSPLKLKPFDKRINVLSPDERKLLYREMSESYEYMVITVTYMDDLDNRYKCIFEGDRDGLQLRNKQRINHKENQDLNSTREKSPPEVPSLKKLFDEDFANTMRQNANRKLGVKAGSVETFVMIPETVYLDFPAKIKFVGYYLSASTPSPYDVCEFLSEMPKETIKDFDSNVEVAGGHTTEVSMTSSKDLVFSGRVYVYHENNFSLQELAALETLYKSKGLSVLFRGISYLQMMSGQKFKEPEQKPIKEK